MRALLVIVALALIGLIAAISLGYVNLSQTQTATLPTIKVEGGQAPKFEADVADVDVGVKNEVIQVPDVSVQKPAGE